MLKIEIKDNWKMRRADNTVWQDAVVPGTVLTDLLRNGQIDDPYWRDNAEKLLPLLEYDFVYQTEFMCTSDLMKCKDILIRFEGIDTIADIYLNDVHVGNTYNMHRIWEFQVKKIVHAGINKLTVVLHSPLKYIRQEFAKSPTLGAEDAMDGFAHIRKAHYMFGWDWAAHLPDSGIFRSVFLLGVNQQRIREVRMHQRHISIRRTGWSRGLSSILKSWRTSGLCLLLSAVPALKSTIIRIIPTMPLL